MPESKLSRMLGLAKESMQTFSAHGVPKLVSHNLKSVKIVWLVFLVGSAGICAWFIQKCIANYLSFNVTSRYSVNFKNSLIFPIVSICNTNTFTTVNSTGYLAGLFSQLNDSSSIDLQNNIAKSIANNGMDKTWMGLNIIDTILKCQFTGIACNISQDFTYYYDVNYGR